MLNKATVRSPLTNFFTSTTRVCKTGFTTHYTTLRKIFKSTNYKIIDIYIFSIYKMKHCVSDGMILSDPFMYVILRSFIALILAICSFVTQQYTPVLQVLVKYVFSTYFYRKYSWSTRRSSSGNTSLSSLTVSLTHL